MKYTAEKAPVLIVCLLALALLVSCGTAGRSDDKEQPQATADITMEPRPGDTAEPTEGTGERAAATNQTITDGPVRQLGDTVSVPGLVQGNFVKDGVRYTVTQANLYSSIEEAGIDAGKMAPYIESRFFQADGSTLRDTVRFLLLEVTAENRGLSPEMGITVLELYTNTSDADTIDKSAFNALAAPVYFSGAPAKKDEYWQDYTHFYLPMGQVKTFSVGWYVDMAECTESSLYLVFNYRIDELREYLPLFPD